MNNILKTGLQTAVLGTSLATIITLSVYDHFRGYDTVNEVKASGKLESGERYLVVDTLPYNVNAMNTERNIHLSGLGKVRTSVFERDWVQTFDVTGKDGKLILPDDNYIKATNNSPWFSENAVANPELRSQMIKLANEALGKSGIDTKIFEGYPDLATVALLENK